VSGCNELARHLRDDQFLAPCSRRLSGLGFRGRRSVSNHFERQFSGTD
jgi:hypothetical protein